MAEMIKLACPSCGGALRSGESANQFKCVQCGNEYVFEQSGHTISLVPLMERLEKGGTVVVGENIYMQATDAVFNRRIY